MWLHEFIRFFLVFAIIAVSPEKLLILDEKADNIPRHTLGPYNEGSAVNITCVSIGGKFWLNLVNVIDSNRFSFTEAVSIRRKLNFVNFLAAPYRASYLTRKHKRLRYLPLPAALVDGHNVNRFPFDALHAIKFILVPVY